MKYSFHSARHRKSHSTLFGGVWQRRSPVSSIFLQCASNSSQRYAVLTRSIFARRKTTPPISRYFEDVSKNVCETVCIILYPDQGRFGCDTNPPIRRFRKVEKQLLFKRDELDTLTKNQVTEILAKSSFFRYSCFLRHRLIFLMTMESAQDWWCCLYGDTAVARLIQPLQQQQKFYMNR